MTTYDYKFQTFVQKQIQNLEKPLIIEFGVKEGRSTKIFLDICRKNQGKLFSVDVEDYSNIIEDPNWTFIQCRDDNFDYLENKLPKLFDVIYLDSLHEADHVEKIFYHYFTKLKINGYFFIDDISWLPYLKNKKRNNFYCEINNKETFNKILSIFESNMENFDLDFNFTASGSCKITKKKNQLNPPSKIKTRELSLKNFVRILLNMFGRK
tara:strand:- start:345 stop:974 length:630 start_codon:yes stop_codon:yes gene_type:complete